MTSSKNLTMVIDGNNLAHRCRYVFSLSNKGIDVSVTYGFLRVMDSLLLKHRPTCVMVMWDGGTPEFRRRAMPSYKANRSKGDPQEYKDFLRQMNELRDILPTMGVISVWKRGSEADDLMYHASRIVRGDVLIVSSDKDMFQAITERVHVLNPAKDDTVYTSEVFEEEYGIPVSKYIDWRALQGDGSDNIEGVKGIGVKTATKLFQKYEELTRITNAAEGRNPEGDNIGGKLGENIVNFGFDRIARNIFVMALYADRVGAKNAILDAVYAHTPCRPKAVKKYFLRNDFSSLIHGNLISKVRRLDVPELELEGVRMPVVCSRREPVDG